MPDLFNAEKDRIANDITASDIVVRVHRAEPTEASPDNMLPTTGGSNYTAGVTVAASGWTTASSGNGLSSNSAAIDFGEATGGDPGTLTHWSAKRGTANVAYGDLTSTAVAQGDSFSINANEVSFTVTGS